MPKVTKTLRFIPVIFVTHQNLDKMIRSIFVGLIFLLICQQTSAQINGGLGKDFGDRISFGGSFGLQFGSVTVINLSPRVGYKFTEKFTGGLGYIYQYISYDKEVYGIPFQSTTYGASVFGRYRFLENFFGTAEFQTLNLTKYDVDLNQKGRVDVPVLFIGGGYLQNIGTKTYVSLSLLYDVLENKYSPYQNPVIQIGIVANP